MTQKAYDKLDREYKIEQLTEFIGTTIHVQVSSEQYTIGCSGKLEKHELGWMVSDGAYGVAIFSESAVESFKFVFRGAYEVITLRGPCESD